MTYEQFEATILAIKNQHEQDMDFGNSIEKYFEDGYLISYKNVLVTQTIKLIGELLDDKSDWLNWWIWEKDFGTKTEYNAYDKDGSLIKLDTIKELYDFLILNKS